MPILELTEPDAGAGLARLHGLCWPRPWDAAAFAELIATPTSLVLASPDALSPTGFVAASIVAAEAEILMVGVDPAVRRHGTGSALVADLLERLATLGTATVFLEVSEANAAARALYQRHSFAPVGRRKAYYPPDTGSGPWTDAIIMQRTL